MVTVSIVVYKHGIEEIEKLLFSLIETAAIDKIYIIDNSPTNELQSYINFNKAEYIFLNSNIGFGAGHNIALRKGLDQKAKYHFVINPDIIVDPITIMRIIEYMDGNSDVGLLMPNILYPDGSTQYLPKLIPRPSDLVIRRIMLLRKIFSRRLINYELKAFTAVRTFNTPIISGCFSCFRMETLKKTGIYDERFFMYFEDFDISRRINLFYKTICFSDVSVIHKYERGAQKSLILFRIFVESAVKYFNKWGWFHDNARNKINNLTLKNLYLKY